VFFKSNSPLYFFVARLARYVKRNIPIWFLCGEKGDENTHARSHE